ncbi:hydrogenase nickel incorporation protein HypB [Rhodopseudomonas palustris]|uniref:Hydrogenase maturation factor HypB n=1 Tax=Thiospirillum jenense TaxID=1653858 RepID=A0A839HK89_9GAMM|nr:hydrogenase nickel incorporation protein HypB [Thiospirillum jenense]MBB1091980.1 hydrogenase nickel incorporation protein HypB [Rhodopseudomonas palustris]MBB1126302.1 hydrogenase nickel incorporation protein HypB [Thiospirillum jenense]
MCDTCGCHQHDLTDSNEPITTNAAGRVELTVLKPLLNANDQQAAHNRAHCEQHGILVINLMSSPGAGKTSLLEATIDALAAELRIAVIEGDLETENDAQRIRAKGVAAVQITTGTACHLDANMVHEALHRLDLNKIDLLLIENVGNLVCPASFDLGQHRNVVLLSVTEGDDKPAKYPVMFRAADLVLITKTDLLPYCPEFQPARAAQALRHLATHSPCFQLNTRSSAPDLTAWLNWLRAEQSALKQRLALEPVHVRAHEHV